MVSICKGVFSFRFVLICRTVRSLDWMEFAGRDAKMHTLRGKVELVV